MFWAKKVKRKAWHNFFRCLWVVNHYYITNKKSKLYSSFIKSTITKRVQPTYLKRFYKWRLNRHLTHSLNGILTYLFHSSYTDQQINRNSSKIIYILRRMWFFSYTNFTEKIAASVGFELVGVEGRLTTALAYFVLDRDLFSSLVRFSRNEKDLTFAWLKLMNFRYSRSVSRLCSAHF